MADIKITDLVDQQAFDQLQKLQQDIDSVEQQYTKAARVLIQGLKVKVEVVGDLDKLTTIANSGIQQAAQATQNLTRAVQQQTTAVGQTTNVISRELSEVEKLNKAQRQQVDLDKDAVTMAREIVGTYQQQVQNLARVETEMKAVSKQKKDLDDQYKSGAITQAQYQSQLASVIAKERELKGEKTEIQQLMSIEEKMNQAVKGSYKELAQQLNMLEQAYMRLTEDEKQSPFGKRLAEAQIELKQHMKDLDADMGNFQRNVGDYAIAGQSLKSQLKDLVLEIATLTVEYRNMSEEERNSAAGQELANKIAQLTEDAGTLKDAIADTNTAIGNAASDTRGFDQLGDALQTLTATFAVGKGAMTAFGISTENVEKAEKQLVAAIAIMNGLQTIQTKLQKESAMMQGIHNIQVKAGEVATRLKTAAESESIIVSKAATVAQKAFNAVAKANPYVLLATAIVTVVGALIAFKAGADDATESQKRLNDATANAEAEAAKARMQMEAYIITIDNFNGSAEQERALVDELNNQYGESVGYHEDLASWKDTLQSKCAQMAQALLLEAQAQAVLNEYVAEYARLRQLQQQQKEFESMGIAGQTWDNFWHFRPGDQGGYKKQIDAQTKSLQALEAEYKNAMLAAQQFKVSNNIGGHTRVNRSGGGGRSEGHAGGGGKSEAQRQAEERAKYEEELQKTLKKLRADSLEAQNAELENLLITYQEKQAQITGNTKDEIEARELLSDEYEKACEEVIKKYADAQKQAEEELHKKHMEFLEETFSHESTARDQDYRMQQAELKQMLADKEITQEEYEKRTAEMSEQYAIDTAEASIRYLESVLNAEELTTEERIAYAEKLADAKIALADATASKQIAANERIAEARKKADEDEKKAHEQKMKNAQDLMKASMDCMNAVADLASNIFEGQMQELDAKSEANSAANEAEIANIEALEEKGAISKEEAESRKRAANAKSKAQEEQIAKEKAALELKQAKLNKAMSIMTISLNTAMAVMNALATAPWPINIAMAALAGTTGAIQLAAAIAEPLPTYKDGTNYHPGGPAIVGDGGKVEGVLLPNGKAFLTPDSPTMVNLPAGAKVIPDASTLNLDGLNPTPLVSVARSSDGSPIIINDYNDLQREIAKGNALTKQMMKQQAKIARDQRYAAYIASRM